MYQFMWVKFVDGWLLYSLHSLELLMKVGTLPVTRARFVPETSPPMIGYWGDVQLIKTGGRGGVSIQNWSHLSRKLKEFSNI